LKDEFKVGSRVKGIVKRVADYGAFVEVKEGIDGLLRTSELSWTRRVKNAREILNPGDELELEVLNFNLEKKMIGLSLKNTMPNPWDNISAKYNIGNAKSVMKLMWLLLI